MLKEHSHFLSAKRYFTEKKCSSHISFTAPESRSVSSMAEVHLLGAMNVLLTVLSCVYTRQCVENCVLTGKSNMPRLFPPHANLQQLLISCLHSLSHSRVSWSYKGIGGNMSLYGLLVLFSLLNLTSLYVSSSLFNLGILFLFCFRTTYAAKAIFAFVILLPKSSEF